MLAACATPVDEGLESYVVRPEDTLYSIAWRHDLDFRDLARWNRIGPDFRIAVGQVLILGPNSDIGPPASASPPPQPQPQSPPGVARPANGAPHTRMQEPARVGTPQPLPPLQPSEDTSRGADHVRGVPGPSARSGQGSALAPQVAPAAPGTQTAQSTQAGNPTKWIWPTGHNGAPRAVPGGGLLFSGRLGQDVRAACAGHVVYAGNGLRGYGNLIIIKHGDSLLSAYAHNREILVHDGQDVAMGQIIAHMGLGTAKSANLYFEIRQNGRPVDPWSFLPSK